MPAALAISAEATRRIRGAPMANRSRRPTAARPGRAPREEVRNSASAGSGTAAVPPRGPRAWASAASQEQQHSGEREQSPHRVPAVERVAQPPAPSGSGQGLLLGKQEGAELVPSPSRVIASSPSARP